MYILSIVRKSRRTRGSKFGGGGHRCRHVRQRRPANSHVHDTSGMRIRHSTCTSACWLTTYGFATNMDTTGSSQNRDERLQRRRERERTRHAAETAEQRERRLRQRRERDRARRAAQSSERRDWHLSERLASETAEEREDRLQRLAD